MTAVIEQVLNHKDITFEEPNIHYFSGVENKHFYLQELKYQNKSLYIQSDWFVSEGPKVNSFQKPEILLKAAGAVKNTLQSIEALAKAQIKYPTEYEVDEEKKDEYFKCIPDKSDFLYCKMAQDAQCFDIDCHPLAPQSLSYGRYRAILHVKGIYIGQHGPSKSLASLMIKVEQLQYESLVLPCLFSSHVPNNENILTAPKTPPPSIPPTPQLKKKQGRKPRLQRQNAVMETSAASSSNSLFADLNLE